MIEINLKIVTQYCPIQIEGSVNGVQLYYRARSGRWELYRGGVVYQDGQPVSLGTGVESGPCEDGREDSVGWAMSRIFDNWPAWGLEQGF